MFKPYVANYEITRNDSKIIFLFFCNCNYACHRIIEAWDMGTFIREDRIVEEIASTIKEEKEY